MMTFDEEKNKIKGIVEQKNLKFCHLNNQTVWLPLTSIEWAKKT